MSRRVVGSLHYCLFLIKASYHANDAIVFAAGQLSLRHVHLYSVR